MRTFWQLGVVNPNGSIRPKKLLCRNASAQTLTITSSPHPLPNITFTDNPDGGFIMTLDKGVWVTGLCSGDCDDVR